MKKFSVKKRTVQKGSLALALLFGFSGTFAFASDYITSDGEKYINVNCDKNWTADETVTFNVVNISGTKKSGADLTWRDLADKAVTNPEIIAYYNIGSVIYDKKGNKCSFNIELDKSGLYKCFLSNQSGENEIFTFTHTVSSKQKSAVDSIISACASEKSAAVTAIKNVIEENVYNLGLFDDLYTEVTSSDDGLNNAVGFVYDYVKNDFNKNDKDYVNILSRSIVRGFLAESINMGKTQDLYNHEYAIGIEDLGLKDFEKKQYSNILNSKMCGKKFTSVKGYDRALAETFTGMVIEHNDGSGEIPSIIKLFSEMSGIDKSKVTDSLCDSLAGSDMYYDFETLKKYVDGYKKPSNNGGGGGGSSSGGGSYAGGIGGNIGNVEIGGDVDFKNDTSSGRPVFSDVGEEHWAREYVEQLYREGIISGISADEFAPDETVTREQFVKLLVLALKLNTVGDDAPFKDNIKGEWYHDYLNIAYNSEIVNGVSEDYFGVGQNIIRQDIAVMVSNALKLLDYDFSDTQDLSFNDNDKIDDYAKDSVKLLKNAGILSGDENNNFNPLDNATRAEAAKIIYMISR